MIKFISPDFRHNTFSGCDLLSTSSDVPSFTVWRRSDAVEQDENGHVPVHGQGEDGWIDLIVDRDFMNGDHVKEAIASYLKVSINEIEIS